MSNVRPHQMRTPTIATLAQYPQPEWNDETSVIRALELTAVASDRAAAKVAYGRLLHAVGNDHAGTYFPVVLALLPAFGDILKTGAPWAQWAVVEALTDLTGSFEPEKGFEHFLTPGESDAETLAVQFRRRVQELQGAIESVAASSGPAAHPAAELATLLANEA
jgi:hypothetical protein